MSYPTGRCPFCQRDDIKVVKKNDDKNKDAANYRLKEHPTKKGGKNNCRGSNLPPSVLT